jgi:hypothetical protein
LTPTPQDGDLGGDASIIINVWIKARGISGTPTYGGLILTEVARRDTVVAGVTPYE